MLTLASLGKTRGLALRLIGDIGLTIIQFTFGWRIIPCPRLRLYAVDPVEVDIKTPSEAKVVANVSLI